MAVTMGLSGPHQASFLAILLLASYSHEECSKSVLRTDSFNPPLLAKSFADHDYFLQIPMTF